jgi:poly(3-hydroxybutyrate) depolymerase
LNLSNNSTIFVAPDGLNAGWANAGGQDVTFTDDLLKQVEADLCIDTSRVFANGFSFGAAMTYVLACVRPTVFRAVAVYSGSPTLTPGCANGIATPVAYYGSHGTNDGTLAFSGGEAVRDSFVRANGCTPISPDPMPPNHGHACVSYAGCTSGHPVRWCPFQGGNPLGAGTSGTGHTPSPLDQGSPTTWNPAEVWAFFSQF